MSESFSSRHPVVCLLPARNAAQELPGFFESAARFCDAIVALDDGSTDATGELLAACPLVKTLLRNPRREDYRGWDDAANRNRLLAAAGELGPEWIISIDADERIDPGDAAALREFLSRDALPGCAYGFQIFSLWQDLEHFVPRSIWVYRLFAFAPGQSFPNRRLHFVPIPTSIPRAAWLKTTLRLQHLGGFTEVRRQARFEKYRQADPDCAYQADYSHLLEQPQEVLPWEPRPPDLPVLLAAADVKPEAWEEPAIPSATEEPALSAIVIARDDEARIARTVASVVSQECPEPFEVIVVASGTDRTAAVVRERFPQVTVVELPGPALPGQARNAGLRLARGTFVSFPGSHVELPPGSLAARLKAHRLGYAMVTGVTLNGTRTWAGWASYFLDHYTHLPGQPGGVLYGPPASCSYARAPLLEVGGFPEDMRAGEDTAVNRALSRLGYVAYRDPQTRQVHHSPCSTPWRLVRHHFTRGRGWGRLLLQDHREGGRLLTPRFVRRQLLGPVPQRLGRTTRNILRWAPEHHRTYRLAFPLVVAGAVASWLGTWYELLRPTPGKASILLGRPTMTLLVVGVAGGRADTLLLMRLDLLGRRARSVSLPCDLLVARSDGRHERLDEALGLGSTGATPEADPGLFSVRDVIGRNFEVSVDDFALVDQQTWEREAGKSNTLYGALRRVLQTSLGRGDLLLLLREARRLPPESIEIVPFERGRPEGETKETASPPAGDPRVQRVESIRERLGLPEASNGQKPAGAWWP